MAVLVLTAANDVARRSCKLLPGNLCSTCTWLRSLFTSADAAGATVDIHTSSCTPLVQLSSDLSVPNHSGHARHRLPTFCSPIRLGNLPPEPNRATEQPRLRFQLCSVQEMLATFNPDQETNKQRVASSCVKYLCVGVCSKQAKVL